MGECKYCLWNQQISYGKFQCSYCEPVSDFCLTHKDLHIELHPSHKDYIVDKELLFKISSPEMPKKVIFGSAPE